MLDAPAIVPPLNAGLALVMTLSTIGAIAYGVAGVSGRVWLSHHGNHAKTHPVIWDAFLGAAIVSVVYSGLTGAQRFAPGRFLPDAGLPLGFVNGFATSITLGTASIALIAVLALGSLRITISE